MMQLAHIALVQWHLFGREDLAISGDSAILGQNRSGKSTLIDLIQAVMTGGSRRWYQFNRSAGETGSRKSERTLRGYCLGQLNEHEFLREEAVTHIALVFDDPAGQRPPVSVGLCIEASVLEEAQVVGRYIAPGIRIDTAMLVEELDSGQQRSAPWALARERLEQACAAKGTALIRPDGPRNHIREYMRQLFTGRRHSDPERFIRAFVMALSFEDMRSVEGFVHNFLLAKNDIDIGELRESIQRYRDIQKDIHELERRLEALRALAVLVADFVSLLEREEVARGVSRLAGLIEAGAALLANLQERRDNKAALEETQREIARYEAEAAEALLGRDREAVLVEPEHASRAVEILRGSRDTYRGCRVVNTRRLAEQPPSFDSDSLAAVFASSDPLALAFIRFRTGQVRRADSQSELMGGGRAIMRDGAYNSGIVVEVLRTQDLKIGRAAAPLMEAELVRQIEERRGWLANHGDSERFHDDIVKKLDALIAETAAEDRLDLLVSALDQHDESRVDLQKRLDAIAATIDPRIQEGLDRLKLQLRAADDDKGELTDRRGSLRQAGLEIQKRLDAGDGLPGSWLCLRARRTLFRDRVRSLAQLAPLREPYVALRPRPLARVAQDMVKRADDARDAYRAREGEIREALGHYRASFDSTAPVAVQGSIVSEVKPWLQTNVQALEENELIQYRRQADEAADQIGILFRTSFIHELNARFNDLKTEIDTLTRALKARPLHGEIYTLHARPKEEFAALHRLARDSENDEQLFDALFGRAEPRDEEHARALAEIERLLGDAALDFTAYQDYRNYYTFDLRMEDVAKGRQTSFDKRKGTASGAERQVPYYVVIGAALSSIYHGARRQYEPDELGLGLAVFDEAFSKMDGPNQRTLLQFYDDIGLQVLIAAPTEKRSVVYENLDTVIDVFRHGDTASAEVVRIKSHARTQMRAANPQHLSNASLEALLDAPTSDAAE